MQVGIETADKSRGIDVPLNDCHPIEEEWDRFPPTMFRLRETNESQGRSHRVFEKAMPSLHVSRVPIKNWTVTNCSTAALTVPGTTHSWALATTLRRTQFLWSSRYFASHHFEGIQWSKRGGWQLVSALHYVRLELVYSIKLKWPLLVHLEQARSSKQNPTFINTKTVIGLDTGVAGTAPMVLLSAPRPRKLTSSRDSVVRLIMQNSSSLQNEVKW